MPSLTVGLRRVLVTGATGGIGREVVRALVACGSRVCATGRRADALEGMQGDNVVTVRADLLDADGPQTVVTRAHKALGGLDGVVCAAGAVTHQRLEDLNADALSTQLKTNFEAPLFVAKAALPLLDSGGAIVLVTSTLAERPVLTSVAYSASKAALSAAMKVMALEAAPRARVNAVSPGVIDTPMIRVERGGESAQQVVESLRQLHPMGRLGQPADVAHAIVFALEAAWMTGSVLRIDGGLLLRE